MYSVDSHPDPFCALVSFGLISREQHEAVLTHPNAATHPPIFSPAQALAWMRVNGFVTDEDINASAMALAHSPAQTVGYDDAGLIILHAEDLLWLGDRGITQAAVDVLFAEDLIDAEMRDLVFEQTPAVGTACAAPAATLTWMVNEGLLEKEVFDATRKRVEAESAFAGEPECARIMAEVQAALIAEQQEQTARQALIQRNRRILTWGLGLIAIFGALYWVFRAA